MAAVVSRVVTNNVSFFTKREFAPEQMKGCKNHMVAFSEWLISRGDNAYSTTNGLKLAPKRVDTKCEKVLKVFLLVTLITAVVCLVIKGLHRCSANYNQIASNQAVTVRRDQEAAAQRAQELAQRAQELAQLQAYQVNLKPYVTDSAKHVGDKYVQGCGLDHAITVALSDKINDDKQMYIHPDACVGHLIIALYPEVTNPIIEVTSAILEVNIIDLDKHVSLQHNQKLTPLTTYMVHRKKHKIKTRKP